MDRIPEIMRDLPKCQMSYVEWIKCLQQSVQIGSGVLQSRLQTSYLTHGRAVVENERQPRNAAMQKISVRSQYNKGYTHKVPEPSTVLPLLDHLDIGSQSKARICEYDEGLL